MTQFTASLWGDEGWAATLAVKPIIKIITLVAKDTSPPLYYLFLHTWMKIFGTSEIAIRSLSFLFFLATALTAFLIGKDYFKNKKTGLLAALLVLTNPFLFKYAFDGRMYSLLALTCILSVYFFLKKKKIAFALAATAALYTHHFAIFIVFWEGIWSLLKKRKIWPFFLIGLLYLPWLYPLYYQTSLVASGFWLGKPTLRTIAEVVTRFLAGEKESLWRTLALAAIAITLIRRRWQRKDAFFLGWFFFPLLATFTLSQFFQSIFFDRYLLISIPAASLLIASARRKASLVFILLASLFLSIINYQYFVQPTKRPFQELASFVKKEAPELNLINYNAAAHHLWESKYYGLKAPIYSPQPLPFYVGTALMEENDVIAELPPGEVIGVISSAPVSEVNLSGYHQIRHQSFKNQLFFLWMKKDLN